MHKWECNGVEFKQGDKIRIMRPEVSFAQNGMGEGRVWHNVWESDMDHYLGHEFNIMAITDEGVWLDTDEKYGFLFPLSSLDNLTYKKLQESV